MNLFSSVGVFWGWAENVIFLLGGHSYENDAYISLFGLIPLHLLPVLLFPILTDSNLLSSRQILAGTLFFQRAFSAFLKSQSSSEFTARRNNKPVVSTDTRGANKGCLYVRDGAAEHFQQSGVWCTDTRICLPSPCLTAVSSVLL